MVIKIDKRERAQLFRDRLQTAMSAVQMSQSALARRVGVDRSTLSQLLKDRGARLPNAQLVAEVAAGLGVSADWLLGLSDRPEQAADLVATAISMTEAPRAMVDDQIFAWHQEAAGYKIRHVPAGLPDMLKTEDMLRWEYAPSLGKTIDQAIGASRDRLNWMRGARSDYEIALPMAELEAFAGATGYYAGISPALRQAQLLQFRDLHAQLYPSLRLHIFDKRQLFSAPVTVFGPLLAVIYIGQNYLVFRDTDRVVAITQHFDALVRAAAIGQRELAAYFDGLIGDIAA
ncbi:helix-turn-helix transcriptional regulator [Cognatiyoonia sp. IB215182]|uniref:helix-turn-helix domain-containing protein n=1 Tax=Cognatiyoonia sp. IB215182 TaxID=3097353 RepID=UPI002A159E9B|nr:helix-turn-helix transcriptional regulator [Cognatiyoonia sp. IB215182]MDX8351003.1 helix-turn-helix transcriptional regulator [Cognatiyoonia sp. IB215182]